MLLTVEYDKPGTVGIYCDKEGLDLLISRLVKLKERGGHDHLMTPSWAGWELTEEIQGEGNQLINELTVRVKPEVAE